MSTAMLNVRLDKQLKAAGDRTLSQYGISTTEVIRNLYKYMEENGKIPEICLSDSKSSSTEEKRNAMRRLVGIAKLNPGEDLSALRAERLSRLKF